MICVTLFWLYVLNKGEKAHVFESTKAYIERLKTDEEFRERMKDAADKEARIALVNAEGFDFSEEDIKAVESELSDDELEAVSGGGGNVANVGDCRTRYYAYD